MRWRIVFLLGSGLAVWLLGGTAAAQPPDRPPSPLTLREAIQFGLDHFPSVQASLARVSAAQSGIDLARTAYLPRVDVGFQESRGTFNNVSGLYFSNSFTQPISGADLGRRSYSSAWGSSGGIAAAWEPFDFGLRAANVEAARAAEQQATAGVALTRLEVGLGVGDAFLAVVAAQEAVRARQANVERLGVFAKTVDVLVKNELRPGVDASRARAELALARTQLIQAQQTEEIARATLAEVLGVAGVAQNSPVEPAAGAEVEGASSCCGAGDKGRGVPKTQRGAGSCVGAPVWPSGRLLRTGQRVGCAGESQLGHRWSLARLAQLGGRLDRHVFAVRCGLDSRPTPDRAA